MVIICGYVTVPASQRDHYVAAHVDLVRRGRAAPGCRHLAITADPGDDGRVELAEVWEDAAALDAWRSVASAPDTGELMTGGDVRRYDAEDGGPLF